MPIKIKFYFTNIQKYTFRITSLYVFLYFFHEQERVFLQSLCEKCAKNGQVKVWLSLVGLFYTCISNIDIVEFWCIMRIEDFMIDKIIKTFHVYMCINTYTYIQLFIQVLSVILHVIFILKGFNITCNCAYM